MPGNRTTVGNEKGSGGCSAAKLARVSRIQSRCDSTNALTSAGLVRRGTTTSTRPRGKTLIESRRARPLSRTEKPDMASGSSVSENRDNWVDALCTPAILRNSLPFIRLAYFRGCCH